MGGRTLPRCGALRDQTVPANGEIEVLSRAVWLITGVGTPVFRLLAMGCPWLWVLGRNAMTGGFGSSSGPNVVDGVQLGEEGEEERAKGAGRCNHSGQRRKRIWPRVPRPARLTTTLTLTPDHPEEKRKQRRVRTARGALTRKACSERGSEGSLTLTR